MAKKFTNRPSLAAHIASLHIKKNTASTSNELSLSVLDALSSRASDKPTSPGTTQPLGGVSLFTLEPGRKSPLPTPSTKSGLPTSGLKGTDKTGADLAGMALDMSRNAAAQAARKRAESLPDPEVEIARRKKRRRIRRIAATCAGLMASALAIGAFAIFVGQEFTTHQTYKGELNSSIDALVASDALIVNIDELLTTSVVDDNPAEIQELMDGIELVLPDVYEARDKAASAAEGMYESTDREAARQAQQAADARVGMLEAAQELLSLRLQAVTCMSDLGQAWSVVLKADSLAKEAAALVTDTTVANTQLSQAKSEEARTGFMDARDQIVTAAQDYDDVDVSALLVYLDKRIEAMGYAIASDEAIYIQDKTTAETQNEYYNTAEAEAVEMAKELPKDIKNVVIMAYDTDVEELTQDYQDARTQAISADAFLRDYVGSAS